MVNDSTLKRRENLYDKLYKNGIDVKTARNYNIKEWNSNLGTNIRKKASLDGQKRLLDQISVHRKDIVDFHIKKNKIRNPNTIKYMEKESKRLTEKVVRVKDKIQVPKIPKRKMGEYNITKVITKTGGTRYLTWSTLSEWRKRIANLDRHYTVIEFKTTRKHEYKEFKTKELIRLAKKSGIKL